MLNIMDLDLPRRLAVVRMRSARKTHQIQIPTELLEGLPPPFSSFFANFYFIFCIIIFNLSLFCVETLPNGLFESDYKKEDLHSF
jgi:hypothetical protein